MDPISVLFLLFLAPWTAEANIKVEGVEGAEVMFQCAHKFALRNPKYLCKNMCKSKEDVLVTVKYGETAQSGRITLVDLKDGTFTVNINQLQLSDSGRYWCAVDRLGLDTFTAVNLTVKKAAKVTPTVQPDVSPTWNILNIFNTTLILEMETSGPTNVLTTSNCTNRGEENFSTSALYATMGAVSMLILLVLATSFRKHREISKPQPQVCSNSRDTVNADQRQQADHKFNDIDGEEKIIKKSPERTFCAQDPKLNPLSSKSAAADAVPFHIYENISSSRGAEHSKHSVANVPTRLDNTSRIYIKPLPPVVFKETDGASAGKHTSNSTGNKEGDNSATSGSDTCSTSCCDSTELRDRSLWFGLDISGTI